MSTEELHSRLRESATNLPIPELMIATGHITAAAQIISRVSDGTERLGEALTSTLESGSRCQTAGWLLRLADGRLLDYIMQTGGELYPASGPAYESVDAATAQQLRARHEYNVMNNVVDTFRGLGTLKNLMREGFNIDPYELIRNKVVCDMGSGWGGLAKTALVEKTGAIVHCVNPRLSNPSLKAREEIEGRKRLQALYPKLSDEEIRCIQGTHDKYLRTEFAHNISLPDASVDVIIDSVAVHTFMSREPDLYRQTVAQYARILRHDGLVIVVDAAHGYGRSAAEIKFRQQAAYEAGLRYRPVTDVYRDTLHGAILWKQQR